MTAYPIRILPIVALLYLSISSCGSQDEYLSDWEEIEKKYNDYKVNSDSTNNDSTNNNIVFENIGVYNAIKNIKQLCHISYTLSNDLKCETNYNSGTNLIGLIYSSTRHEDLLVPNNVSLWTFLSAASDPNSYFYTRDISLSPYNIKGQAHAYYGQVCSSAIQYALGIKYNFQMIQMHQWDGMELISEQIIDSIKPGVILMSKGHVMMCIDIERNKDGSIKNATIAEGRSPLASYSKYNTSRLNTIISNNGYQLYKYKYIDNTGLVTSPFTDSEGNVVNSISFNKNIMPRRGDKANWRKDENVEIDILNIGNYNAYKLFRNDTIIDTIEIDPSLKIINLGIQEYGNYKMCLTDGIQDSDYVYWIVVDYDVRAEKYSDYASRVTFSSKNATPIFLTWRLPHSISASNNNMPQWTVPLSQEDLNANSIITSIGEQVLVTYPRKTWELSVHFETEYGILKSDNVTIDIGN